VAIEQIQMQAYAKQYGQLVARAWGDEAFKARLLADPAPALAEQGIPVPPGVEVRVHENTPTVVHLALPPRPGEELSDEQLDAIAGGVTDATYSTMAGPYTLLSSAGCFSAPT
jgi:hypothetical protein